MGIDSDLFLIPALIFSTRCPEFVVTTKKEAYIISTDFNNVEQKHNLTGSSIEYCQLQSFYKRAEAKPEQADHNIYHHNVYKRQPNQTATKQPWERPRKHVNSQ